MSHMGNDLVSVGFVWVDTHVGFFPSPRCQCFWNTDPFEKLLSLLRQIQKLVTTEGEMSKLISLGDEAGEDTCYSIDKEAFWEVGNAWKSKKLLLIIVVAFTLCCLCLCFCEVLMQM